MGLPRHRPSKVSQPLCERDIIIHGSVHSGAHKRQKLIRTLLIPFKCRKTPFGLLRGKPIPHNLQTLNPRASVMLLARFGGGGGAAGDMHDSPVRARSSESGGPVYRRLGAARWLGKLCRRGTVADA